MQGRSIAGMVLCIWLACIFFLAEPTRASQRVALVIGNADYRHATALHNPRNDARAVSSALGRLGFTVEKVEDAGKGTLESRLADFRSQSRGAELAVLYYAGHAIQIEGRNYLVPVDAQVRELADISLRLVTLNVALQQMHALVNVVILDACRDNPFAEDLKRSADGLGRSLGATRGLAREEKDLRGGTYLIMAAAPEKEASDGPKGGNSPYTAALLQHIETPDLDLRFLHARVRESVEKNTGGAQTPEAIDRLPSRYIYLASSGAVVERRSVVEKATLAAEAVAPPVAAQPDDRFTNSLGMAFVWIPSGTFMRGSPTNERNRFRNETQHRVTLSRGFYMMTTEVTRGQWRAVMGGNPSRIKSGDNYPVESVLWNDVQEFIKRLNQREGGNRYRLPTEAEWEYAARAGSTTRFSFGDDESRLGEYAWFHGNSGRRTNPVGAKKPNAWGLYDMHGNVWEWCQDWYGAYPSGSVTDPQGPSSGTRRVLRGGSYGSFANFCRSANRHPNTPDYRYSFDGRGFRLVLPQV